MADEVVAEPVVDSQDPVIQKLAKSIDISRISDMKLERIVYSGDPSSLPQFHYRWKRKYLADYVVRVKSVEEVKAVFEVAQEHKIAVVPRGGASSCLGSSSPSRGGISLDIKRMDQILEVNTAENYIRVEPGVPFSRLETELAKQSLEFGIYPSSAKSAVIGGWIGCGGSAGIGTPLYGPLIDNILELQVVKPDGEVVTITGDQISVLCGSYGILGIITEVKLRVRPLQTDYRSFSYGFSQLEHLIQTMIEIADLDKKPVYLKIADSEFQKYSNPLEKGKYVLSVTYPYGDEHCPTEDLERISSNLFGTYLGDDYSIKEWELRYDCEFNPKEHCETLMFQELSVDLDKVYEIVQSYEETRRTHKVPALMFGMLASPRKMRIELMAMLDPDQYLKFIASKGILHKMVKKSIKAGGGPYTIGLQNSIYMKRAFPEHLEKMKQIKQEWDPHNICNPDRVTTCMTSYARMNILFELATKIRWLSKFIGS